MDTTIEQFYKIHFMIKSANIATFPPRRKELTKMLKSIEGQFDEVRIYFNNIKKRPKWIPSWVDVYCGDDCNGDLTDNGKFFFLEEWREEYYFTLDDDIAYPATYAEDMVRAIQEHQTIVTHHGRKLKQKNVSYYRGGHRIFMCLHENLHTDRIDVAGTGVTAYDTRYFNPVDLWESSDQKMSDIIFSLEAVKQGKDITVLPHEENYFRYLFPEESTTIHQQSFRKCDRQTEFVL